MQHFTVCLIGLLILLSPGQSVFAQEASTNPTPDLELRGPPSTAARIRERGDMLIVGVLYDYAPFSFFDAGGNAAGFEVELTRAVAEEWGVAVTFVPVAPSTRIQSLLGGQIDLLAAALPQTLANETAIDFSTAYFYDTNALLLPATSQIISFEALAGKTIAAIQGDQAITRLNTHLAGLNVSVDTLPFQEPAPALLALKAGQADALLGDSAYLSYIAQQQLDLSVLLPLPGESRFGFGLMPGDSFFRKLVDATLQELYLNGTYEEIYQKWFGANTAVASMDAVGADLALPPLSTLPGKWPFSFATLPNSPPQPILSQLAILRTRGTLLAGVSYDMPPFGFLDETGRLTGFDVAIAREFAKRWLGDSNAVELVRVTPDTATPLLKAGQVDLLAAALPRTWSDSAEIDFSMTYYLDQLGILVRADSGIESINALAGKTVATVAGLDDWNLSAQRFSAEFAIQPTILPFQEYRMAEQALLAGQIDAMIGSTTVLSHTISLYPNLRLLSDILTPQPYGIGLRHYDPELRDLINLTLQVMKLDGTYERLYRQWFLDEPNDIALWVEPYMLRQLHETEADGNATALPLTLLALPNASAVTVTPTVMPVPLQVNTPAIAAEPRTVTPSVETTPSALLATPTTEAPATAAPGATPTVLLTTVSAATQPARPILLPTVAMEVTVDATPSTVTTPAQRADTGVLTTSGSFSGSPVAMPLLITVVVTDAEVVTESVPSLTPTPSPTANAGEATATISPTISPTISTTPTPQLLIVSPTLHRIRSTDSLATIAQEYYGQQSLWRLIYEANREIIGDDPNFIPVGVELLIPPQP